MQSAGAAPRGLADYVNVPYTIAAVVSSRLATLHELDTVYGLEDLWTLLEVNSVDLHNRSLAAED